MATTQPEFPSRSLPSLVREARGGVSGGAILTGVVVAFGAMTFLSLIVAGVVSLGLPDTTPFPGTEVEGTVFAGVVLAITQFVAYLWGGYTAGRMARGAGWANGALVPVVALLILVVGGAVVATLGSTSNSTIPFRSMRYPLDRDVIVTWGAGIGIATVVAMFAGGAFGGVLGARWHSRLERETASPASPPPDPKGPTDTA